MKQGTCKFLFLLSGIAALCAISVQAQTTYYVSTAGSDNNNGTAPATPFKTIGKAASVMTAGSRCLIARGIYRETVKPTNSGTSQAPMSFEAINNDLVYISGADIVTGWTAHSGSIYKAPMTWNLGKFKNQIIVDGKMAWNARTPNVDDNYSPSPDLMWCGDGFGVVDRRRWQQVLAEPIAVPQRVCFFGNGTAGYNQPGSAYNFIVSDDATARYQLPSTLFNHPNDFFKGGIITVQNLYWMGTGLINSSISSSNRTVINSNRLEAMSQETSGAPGWISHLFALLDAPNEWYRDSATQILYLWAPDGGNPSTHLVEAKRRVLGFDLTGKNYINLKGLCFIAASLTTKNATNCTIEECQFKYVSHDDVPSLKNEMGVSFEIEQNVGDGHLGLYLGGSNNTMRKCMVRGSANSGIVIGGKYCTVTNCRVTSCDYSITYHAGILLIPDNGDWSESNKPIGAQITNCYFAYNNRANIQVGCHAGATADPKVGLRINHNEFSTCGYTSETGQVAMQSCAGGDLSYNRFHDAAWYDVGSTCLEEDFGAHDWKIHHNLFYQGDSSVVMAPGGPVVLRCCDFTFSYYGGDSSMCFNNTVVDLTDPGHADWQYMTGFDGVPWPVPINKNNLWAKSDTAPWHFSNPVKRDYTLRSDSKAIDAGEIIPRFVDTYKGKAPDLGAFEYGDTPWTAGPDWAEQPWTYPPPQTAVLSGPLRSAFSSQRMYLNAANGILRIEGSAHRIVRIAVVNAAGATVLRRLIDARAVQAIDMRTFPAGIYMVRASCAGETRSAALVLGGK